MSSSSHVALKETSLTSKMTIAALLPSRAPCGLNILEMRCHFYPQRSLPNFENHRHRPVVQHVNHTTMSRRQELPRGVELPRRLAPIEDEVSNDENVDEDADDDPCKHAGWPISLLLINMHAYILKCG
jgi:hypothetical protein